MRPVARLLDRVRCPHCGKKEGVILTASHLSLIGGRPIARVGDRHSLGGIILTGSPHDLIEGRPIARMGDRISCYCGGVGLIVSGSPDYLC